MHFHGDFLRVFPDRCDFFRRDVQILIDRFLNHALECEADAISDGTHAFVPAVMEHIELAGGRSTGYPALLMPGQGTGGK